MIGIVAATLAALFCSIPLLYWVLLRAHRWIRVFFGAAILLPPLPLALGDSGPHPALLFAGSGALAGILTISKWRNPRGSLPLFLTLFTAIILASVAPAAIYSGSDVALGSLARALLFAIGPYVFLYALSVPISSADDTVRTARMLFRFATLAAVFACIDFHFQLPAPAGYEPQFIWLGDVVLRRAQGLFYEASTLGNFCAFFLVMILATLTGPKENRICGRVELIVTAIVFGVALVFSYSRASLVNVLCAGLAMLYMQRRRIRGTFVAAISVLAVTGIIYALLPEFGASYWLRVEYSFLNLSDSPAQVLSGRVSSWVALTDFILQHPWHLLLGIGYKTLPYSDFPGRQIITDNTYLSLLVETGVLGLAVFLFLNISILRAGFRAARAVSPRASFFGRWITCFWIGELVQMLSGDLITYWRVLPIYLWVLATAVRETRAACPDAPCT